LLDSYHNRHPGQLAAELDAARRVGFMPVEVPGPAFDALAAGGAAMIYVVVGDRLLVSQRRLMDEHITHAVPAGGEPVHAAGEVKIGSRRDTVVVAALNNASGHYQPEAESLAVAREAFESRGVPVRPDGVRHYDWRRS